MVAYDHESRKDTALNRAQANAILHRISDIELRNLATTDINAQFKRLMHVLLEFKVQAEAETKTVLARIEQSQTTVLDVHARDRLLESLSFPDMRRRQQEVSEAHAQTFRWAFEKSDDKKGPY